VYPDKLVSFTFTVYDRMSFYETSLLTLYGEEGLLRFGVLPGLIDVCESSDDAHTPGQWTRWSEGAFAVPFVGRPSPYSELPQIGNLTFFEREATEWVAAIKGAPCAGVTAADALQVAQVIKAAYESSERGGLEVNPRL
jgi:predicted dehydrogenase